MRVDLLPATPSAVALLTRIAVIACVLLAKVKTLSPRIIQQNTTKVLKRQLGQNCLTNR